MEYAAANKLARPIKHNRPVRYLPPARVYHITNVHVFTDNSSKPTFTLAFDSDDAAEQACRHINASHTPKDFLGIKWQWVSANGKSVICSRTEFDHMRMYHATVDRGVFAPTSNE